MHLRAAWLLCGLVLAGCSDDASVDDTSSGASGSGAAGGEGQGGATATGGSGAAGTGGSGATGTGGGGALPACVPMPACESAPPAPGPALGFEHISSDIAAASGSDNHRGRDLFLNPGDPQWVLGKFSYGILDDDIKDEQVDIYLSRDCQGAWELLGSAQTTEDGMHATVEGVDDTGGRVYFQIPANQELGVGRHRIHMVVRGDLTTADAIIDVVPTGTPVFMSDVDGTLTTQETEEFTALLSGALPNANVDSAEVLNRLADKGYRPFYMTARPEFLGKRTRAFLELHGYPPGIVHTTLNKTGALGSAAVGYKSGELAWLFGKGMLPAWAFGNTDSDAEAYDNGGIQPLSQRIFFQYDDDAYGGRRIEAYTELLTEVDALPAVCQP